MFNALVGWIGLRYTGAKRRNHFISFISLTSMIGLTLGVAVLILVLSVMNGFDRELRQRILGMVPHAAIYSSQPIENWQAVGEQINKVEGVVGTAPFVSLQGMLSHRGSVEPAMIKGIDPVFERKVSIVEEHMERGDLANLKQGEFGIVLGEILARRLRVGLGDSVTMILPEATLSPAGVMPRLKRFTVVGTFAVGAEIDGSMGYIHVYDAGLIKRHKNKVQGIRVQTENLFEAPRLASEIVLGLDGMYYSSDWTHTHGNLFNAIKMEKTMIGLLLMVIVAVAAFNIVSTLVMVVTDKQADIAILRTMGLSSKQVMGIFIVQGGIVGLIGTILGTVFGIILALTVSDIVSGLESLLGVQFLNANVYFISYLPSQLLLEDVLIVSSTAFILGVLATIYPARRAAKIQPAEALRYE